MTTKKIVIVKTIAKMTAKKMVNAKDGGKKQGKGKR